MGLTCLLFAGNARTKDCLEDHREDPNFSSECKEEFEKMMEARAADFRLDSSLREKCADDIEDVCGYEKVRAIPENCHKLLTSSRQALFKDLYLLHTVCSGQKILI